jgi:chromosome segregation protein
MKKKLDKLLEEKEAVTRTIKEIENKRRDKFTETLGKIAENFSAIYRDLSNGIGRLRLEEENNIDSGLIIEASPPGKNVVNLDAMSGGEKTLTSLAFLFAILQLYSSPFYILDEVDAALDKTNTKKIVDVIKKYSKNTQFIIITHNDFTVQEADKVFGVSIEDGVSKVFGIEMPRE